MSKKNNESKPSDKPSTSEVESVKSGKVGSKVAALAAGAAAASVVGAVLSHTEPGKKVIDKGKKLVRKVLT